jgi:hypothetical protein
MFNEITSRLITLENDLNFKSELDIRVQILSIHQHILDQWGSFSPEEGSLLTNKIFKITEELNEKNRRPESN